jgi:hypothetical protein
MTPAVSGMVSEDIDREPRVAENRHTMVSEGEAKSNDDFGVAPI